MYSDILKQADLDQDEVLIYEYLLEHGECSAGAIIKETPLKRGNVYNKLADLVKKGLVEQYDKGKIAHFRVEHPSKLAEYVEQRQKDLEQAKKTIQANLKQLTSDYNLANNKPGITFYEGEESYAKALHDSLNTEEIIYTFVNSANVDQYVKEINEKYVKARIRKGIKKKMIMVDNPVSREHAKNVNPEFTEVKFIDSKKYPFDNAVEIYDDKALYLVAEKDSLMAFHIQHPQVARFHRSIFEYIWQTL